MHAEQLDSTTMTEAEYLAFEESSQEKHEYVGGYVYAMSGGTAKHSAITMNVGRLLGNHLDDGDCTVHSPDLEVYIAARQAFRYPDISVVCGDPIFVEGREDVITNPILLVEVLSPSTAKKDHHDKLHEYTQIPTLHDYLLVAQESPGIELYSRQQETGLWTYQHITGLESDIYLPSLDCTLALSKVYRNVRWE